MSTSADHAGARGLAERLGIEPGQVVQVIGVDDQDGSDIDDELMDDVASRTGTELIYGDDSDEMIDVVTKRTICVRSFDNANR